MHPATLETLEALRRLTPADVIFAYAGARGCACGCRGDYAYRTVDHKGAPLEFIGRPMFDDEVDPAAVAERLTQIRNLDPADIVFTSDATGFGTRHIVVDTRALTYILRATI